MRWVLANWRRARIWRDVVLGLFFDATPDERQDLVKAPQPYPAVQRQLSPRISWSDIHQNVVERRLFRLLVQQGAFLVGQDCRVVVGDDDPAIDPPGDTINMRSCIVGERKVLVDRLKDLGVQ